MKEKITILTRRDALRLLEASGQFAPSPERIELTWWLMRLFQEVHWGVTDWNDSLAHTLTLDSLDLVEMLMSVEETFDVEIDEVEVRTAQLETLGDLVMFLEPRLFSNPTFRRMVNESAKIGHASCPTQAAFYALRRELCGVGGKYTVVHSLRPSTRLAKMTIPQAKCFAALLNEEYGMGVTPFEARDQWTQILHILLLVSSVFCFGIAPALLDNWILSVVLCVWINALVAVCLLRFGRSNWPGDLQTFGDVARKIAALSSIPTAAA